MGVFTCRNYKRKTQCMTCDGVKSAYKELAYGHLLFKIGKIRMLLVLWQLKFFP